MKNRMVVIFTILMVLVSLSACKRGNNEEVEKSSDNASSNTAVQEPLAEITGTVTETMNSGGYTYVQIDTGSKKIWAAGPEVSVKKGDKVSIPDGIAMQNYHSKTLDRTFDTVYFVSSIAVHGAEGNSKSSSLTPYSHGSMMSEAKEEISGIDKPADGYTIAELYSKKDELSGKKVALRGKVVKFSSAIMDRNWIHLQDGTGSGDTKEMIVTTKESANVGDIVLVTGNLTADKDYGYGYKYDVVIEDASVKVE